MKLVFLRLADVQAAGDLTKLEAVEASKKTIYSLSQQGQEEYRTDAAMIYVMEKHVLQSEACSTDVATRRATQTF
jgi:DNA-binding transcriptional regulator PaaX